MIKPFKVNISDQVLEAIYAKVKKYPWHEMPDDGGWEYGNSLNGNRISFQFSSFAWK